MVTTLTCPLPTVVVKLHFTSLPHLVASIKPLLLCAGIGKSGYSLLTKMTQQKTFAMTLLVSPPNIFFMFYRQNIVKLNKLFITIHITFFVTLFK